MLATCLCEEFLLHIPSSGEFLLRIQFWFHFYLGSFSYTSHAGFIFMWWVSLTHPILTLLFIWDVSLTRPMLLFVCFLFVCLLLLLLLLLLLFYKSGEFLLHTPCWLELYLGSFTYTPSARLIFSVRSFSYTALAGFIFYFIWDFIFMWEVSLTHLVLASFLSGELLLHIPCWITFLKTFTHPVLASCLCEEFLLHIPSFGEFLLRIQCWFHFYVGSFSYTSRAGFIFMLGVSLTHPVLASFLSGEFLLHIPTCFIFLFFREFSYKSRDGFILFLGSFSYTSHSDFIFYLGSFSYTSHAFFLLFSFSFLSGEFLLHIPRWLELYLGSFTSTPSARFIFLWGVSLTHAMLAFYFYFI